MLELASKIEQALQHYESENARNLLVSELWQQVRNRTKHLVAELEAKGKHLSATRIDREYTQLAEALRRAVKLDNPPKIKEDFALWDISQELLYTLRAISHFHVEAHRPGPERVTLKEAQERVRILSGWADQQDINMDDRQSKISLKEFAKMKSTTATTIQKYQAWYRKYRKRGELPEDPRMISPSKLKQLFG